MSTFTKSMRFVGDLDDEFYHDERQRDVWNEASAIGFQLFLWCSLIAGAVLPWVAGVTGAWIALSILLVSTLISVLTLLYSNARGVNLYTAAKLGRVRGILAGLLFVLGYGAAMWTLNPDMFAESSTWAGGIVGALAGGALVGALIWFMRRRRDRFENEEI